MQADLHMHSTSSDGSYSPSGLIHLAAQAGFDMVSLTDHDSVDGLEQAHEAALACQIRLIPGVELSCGAAKEIHILGYGFDPRNEALRAFCKEKTSQRILRAQRMVERLCENRAPVSFDRVMEIARGVVGRPHVARALVEAGHAASINDAFARYLSPGRCGYVPKEEVRVAQAVSLIAQAGGVSVLAHPMELKMGDATLESLIGEWKAQGLCGMEVFHPSAGNQHVRSLAHMAQRLGMLQTGGSDFHGENAREGILGQGLARWNTQEQDVAALLEAIRRRGGMIMGVHGCRA